MMNGDQSPRRIKLYMAAIRCSLQGCKTHAGVDNEIHACGGWLPVSVVATQGQKGWSLTGRCTTCARLPGPLPCTSTRSESDRSSSSQASVCGRMCTADPSLGCRKTDYLNVLEEMKFRNEVAAPLHRNCVSATFGYRSPHRIR